MVKLDALRNSGQSVIIDGPCLSACTMVLGVIPRDRLCVTPRARLGFHAAWQLNEAGRQVTSPDGTELLMSAYPQPIRDWIARRGGLSPRLYATMAIFLLSSGLALAQGTPGGTAPSTGSSTTSPRNPSMAPAPTVGMAPGVNPINSQDLTNRSNPQDLTQPGGSNPQDLKR